MLDDLAVLEPEQIIVSVGEPGHFIWKPFGERQHHASFSIDVRTRAVEGGSFGEPSQHHPQPRRVRPKAYAVLHVPLEIEVGLDRAPFAVQKELLDRAFDQGSVRLRLIRIGRLDDPVDLRRSIVVILKVRKVVPVLHDQPVLKAKNIEPNLRHPFVPGASVCTVQKDEVAVREAAMGLHRDAGRCVVEEAPEHLLTVGKAQVVLDICGVAHQLQRR